MLRLALIALFLSCPLSAEEEFPKQVVCATIPKSGTHLLRKAISLLTGESTKWIGSRVPRESSHSSRRYFAGHLFPALDAVRTDSSDRYIKVLMIRDPRDVLLSFANHLSRGLSWRIGVTFSRDVFSTLSLDAQVQTVLTGLPEDMLHPATCFAYAVLWSHDPSVFVCRFEDLIGAQGGGSDERQLATLKKLAQHLECDDSDEKIAVAAKKLFGGTWTFYKGQIGAWREVFSLETLALFHFLYGWAVEDLGYAEY